MKKQIVFPLLVILLSAALSSSMLDRDHDWGDDWAAYVMQAESILTGSTHEFAVRNTFTTQESTTFIGPVAYPWGFPALLVPFYAGCGGLDILCLKSVNVIFFALFLAVFFVFLHRRLSLFDSILLLSVFAFSPTLLNFHNNLLSDIPFLFFSSLALLLIETTLITRDDFAGGILPNVGLGAALFAAFFVRTNGVLLVPTLFLTQVVLFWRTRRTVTRDPRRVIPLALIPYLVFGLLTALILTVFPAGEGSHLEHYAALTWSRVLGNLAAYINMPAAFFENVPLAPILYGATLPFVLGGAVLNAKKDFHLSIYIVLSLALFITWPDTQGIRFLFPLLPFIFYFALRGMNATAFALLDYYRKAGDRLTRLFWAGILLSFIITSIGLARDNLASQRAPDGGPFEDISAEMIEFVKSNTPPDSVLIFYKPRALRLMTGRDALVVDDCAALGKGDYVVIRKKRGAVGQVLPDTVTTCNPSLLVTEVFDNEKYVVYEIRLKP
ncbi:MAG: hypothetical protein AB1554_05290 [Chloroflexota bacterium]